MKTKYDRLIDQNTRAAAARGTPGPESPDVLLRIRNAFELFDSQSAMLRTSFESLKKDLALANEELSVKNKALSGKVEELQQMSSRLHCILESLADGVLVVNTHSHIERCNPAAEQLLGLPRSGIEGRPYIAVMNGLGNRQELADVLEKGRTILDQQRSSVDIRGRRTIVLASVAPIRAPTGSILGAVEVLRDVTQIRALEERVQHQKRMAALGEMAASVAHEIRNPLGTIEGFARLLKHDLDLGGQPEPSRLASKIIEGAQNLNYVITNLLTYARPMSLQYEQFDTAVLLNSVREVLEGNATERQVNLQVNLPAERLDMQGDIRQLRQVLINLGRNAIEACAKGGHVSLDTATRDGSAVMTVSDDGCGIAPEDVSCIFDPFFTRKEGGTGLGLSLCHKIIEAHGGEITVNSKVGAGTILRVALPRFGEVT
ncbi:MAG: ATP-binding protein [Lentisphaerota bacterium]